MRTAKQQYRALPIASRMVSVVHMSLMACMSVIACVAPLEPRSEHKSSACASLECERRLGQFGFHPSGSALMLNEPDVIDATAAAAGALLPIQSTTTLDQFQYALSLHATPIVLDSRATIEAQVSKEQVMGFVVQQLRNSEWHEAARPCGDLAICLFTAVTISSDGALEGRIVDYRDGSTATVEHQLSGPRGMLRFVPMRHFGGDRRLADCILDSSGQTQCLQRDAGQLFVRTINDRPCSSTSRRDLNLSQFDIEATGKSENGGYLDTTLHGAMDEPELFVTFYTPEASDLSWPRQNAGWDDASTHSGRTRTIVEPVLLPVWPGSHLTARVYDHDENRWHSESAGAASLAFDTPVFPGTFTRTLQGPEFTLRLVGRLACD